MEAAPAFPAEEAGGDQFLLQQRGQEARVVEEGAPDRVGDREVHVVTDHVHQLERPHAEAAGLAQHGVEGRVVGGALLCQAQRLGVVGAGDAIDDEARRRFRMHRGLAPGGGSGEQRFGDGVVGGQPGNDLDQRHQRRRVEEMEAGEAFGMPEHGADGGHRDRRGVGAKNAGGGDEGFEARVELPLGLKVLDDRLDHQRAAGQFGEFRHRHQPGARRCGFCRGQPALRGHFRKLAADAFDRAHRGIGPGIE